MLNKNYRISQCKPLYIESIKIFCLHITRGISVWSEIVQKRTKNASNEPSQIPRAVATLGTRKHDDCAGFLLCKGKNARYSRDVNKN